MRLSAVTSLPFVLSPSEATALFLIFLLLRSLENLLHEIHRSWWVSIFMFFGFAGVQDVCPIIRTRDEDNQDLCCKKADCEDNAEKSSGPLSLSMTTPKHDARRNWSPSGQSPPSLAFPRPDIPCPMQYTLAHATCSEVRRASFCADTQRKNNRLWNEAPTQDYTEHTPAFCHARVGHGRWV